ncbi:MAG: LamG-like jellyroll fold domain-containing protein [Planctomycetota bacterium]|jgi:hypothetical protein
MKWSNDYKMRLVLAGIVAAIVVGSRTVNADFTFGEYTNLGPTVNSPHGDVFPEISADGLTLYFCSDRPDGLGDHDLWVTTRASTNDPWPEAVNLGPTVNSPDDDYGPSISVAGLELFFNSDRPGGFGENDLWVARRATSNEDWGSPANLGPVVNSSASDLRPCLSPDGLSLYFSSHRARGEGDEDLYVTRRPTKNDAWTRPVNLGSTVNSPNVDFCPNIANDGLVLIFSSRPPSMYGSYCNLWLTERSTTSDPWETPVSLGLFINTDDVDHVDITPDGTSVFLTCLKRSGGSGWQDIWQAPIMPLVDLNADGIVDAADMCIIVDHWGEDSSLCDIGPMPLGDGIIDAQDLMVLAEHLFEEVTDPTLLAHWALDEAEGSMVHESVSGAVDFVMGSPLWQPTDGKAGGALEFDGVDDCVISDSGPNPAAGPFSIFAWAKGGAPGQVVISQPAGTNWLMADAEGKLMTELRLIGGRVAQPPLSSQTVITDGEWHRIGFVWDGVLRALYVDDTLVAEDTQSGLGASGGGLYIGVGKDFAPGSFFSGLIDDVRVYSRALHP